MDRRAFFCAIIRAFILTPVFISILLSAVSARAEESPGDSLLPDFYDDAMLSTSGISLEDYETSTVDYFSGRMTRSATDVSIPGNGGLALTVTRSYQSQQPYKLPEATAVGVGWNMNFGWVEITDAAKMCSPLWAVSVLDNPVVHLPDGSSDVLGMTGLSIYDPTVVHYRGKGGMGLICGAVLGNDPMATFVLVDAEGKRYELQRMSSGGAVVGFDKTAKWYVKKITDRNGNWLWIDYALLGDGNTQLVAPTRVTASDGRDVFFNYSGNRLTSIQYAGETLVEYEYAPSGSGAGFYDLTRVILREELVWNYRYSAKGDAGAGSMTQARNPFGGVTDYTWQEVYFQTGEGKEPNAAISTAVQDSGTLPRATWRYAFTPAERVGELDTTTVIAPEGTYTYGHYSALGMVSGEVWKVGLKQAVVFVPVDGSPSRVETFDWHGYCIAYEAYKRTKATGVWAAVDPVYWGALLWSHEIRINGATWTTTYGDWSWDQGYVGQPLPQTILSTGPDGRTLRMNRRYIHYPDRNIHFLLHQEWLSQKEFPDRTPMQTDFDDNGNPVRKLDRGYYTFLDWDGEGNLVSSTRGLSGDRQQGEARTTQYQEYFLGVATKVVHPDGTVSRKDADAFGRTRSATDREGVMTRYAYDGVGRVTLIDYPQGNDTHVSYSGTRTTLQRGDYRKVTRTDGFGRSVEETHSDMAAARDIRVTREYDDRGQVVFTSYPNSAAQGMRYFYDGYGRMVRVTHPGGERSYRYFEGSHTEITDENGNATRLYRRELKGPGEGELVRIESPGNIVTTIERNEYGLPLRIAQGDGQNMTERSNTYNSSLVLLASHDPETGEKTYGYDWAGNLTVIRRDDGVAGPVDHHYNLYDLNDRLIRSWAPTNEISLPDGRKQSFDVRLEFSWTPEGRPLDQARHETVQYWQDNVAQYYHLRNSNWHHEYDANGNTTRERVDINDESLSFTYAWDGNDRLQSITYPDGYELQYMPDVFGWPTRAGVHASNVQYHETGQLAGFTYGNGLQATLSVNDRFLLAGINVPGVVALGYQYDPAGNVIAINDGRTQAASVSLGYDAMNRLVIADGPWGRGSFGYDKLGNITQKDTGTDALALAYDASNRMVEMTGSRNHRYGYDGFGNIASRDSTQFGYDGSGNLLLVTDASGAQVAAYQYDARGRRIATVKDGTTTYSLQGNGDHLLYEFEPVEGSWKRNVFLGNIQVASSEYYIACHDDIDGDGIPHCAEVDAGLDPRDSMDADLDLDGDLLTNLQEYQRGTTIDNPDTDDDGLVDGLEVFYGLDPKLADAEADLDADGLPNNVEIMRGFDPANPADGAADNDGDGLSNAREYTLATAWNDADTDNDGMPDGYEAGNGLDPRVNDAGADSDGDGMSNVYEYANGFDPADAGDGDLDPDSDGLSNRQERQAGTDPKKADTDGDGFADGVEVANGMNPVVADADGDADGDGLPNAWELAHGLKPNDATDALRDPDNDGLSTSTEYRNGSDPFVADVVQPPDDVVAATSTSSTLLAWSQDPLATGYNVVWGVLGEPATTKATGVGAAFSAPTSAETLYWFQVEAANAAGLTPGRRITTLGGVRNDVALPHTLPSGCARTQLEVIGDGEFFFVCERDLTVTIYRFGKGSQPAPQSFPAGSLQDGMSGWRFASGLGGNAWYVWLGEGNVLTGARFDSVRARWQDAMSLEDHLFYNSPYISGCADNDEQYSWCRLNEIYAFDIHANWRGDVYVYYAVNSGYGSGGGALYGLYRVAVGEGAIGQREYFAESGGSPVRLVVGSPGQTLIVVRSGGSKFLHVRHTISGVTVPIRADLGWFEGGTLPFDRQTSVWASTRGGMYDLTSAYLCGAQCTPILGLMDSTPSAVTYAFGGLAYGQAYWHAPGAIRYAKVTKNSKGVFAWTRPASLAADANLLDPAQLQFAHGDTSAAFYWSNSAAEIRHIEIRPDATWTAPTVLPVTGKVVDAGSDWAGNTVVAYEKDGNYQFRERRRLPSMIDTAADVTAPVLSRSSVRSGKTTITHVVTLGVDEPANLFFKVVGGTITGGGANSTAEQRYTGPVSISFPKGASATISYRGINMAERWSSPVSAVLQ